MDTNWTRNDKLLTVEHLKLWDENPRLLAGTGSKSDRKIIRELLAYDKKEIYDLTKSIVNNGLTYYERVIVLKKNTGFVVIEGNCRITCLKLLQNPDLAPKSNVKFFRQQQLLQKETNDKIYVLVAPTYKVARKYVLSRHTQRYVNKWESLEKYRFLVELLKDNDYDYLAVTTAYDDIKMKDLLRANKSIKLYNKACLLEGLNENEKQILNNPHKFNITNLERFIDWDSGQKFLGYYENDDFITIANTEAFGLLIRAVINENNLSRKIHDDKLCEEFINEKLKPAQSSEPPTSIAISLKEDNAQPLPQPAPATPPPRVKKTRQTGLIPKDWKLQTTNKRLAAIFDELQKVHASYLNASSVLLRVFLDIAVSEHIDQNNLQNELKKKYHEKSKFLKNRLTFILSKNILPNESKQVIQKLFSSPENYLTLDTLNFFIHSSKAAPLMTKELLNSFWEALLPLLEELLVIEKK